MFVASLTSVRFEHSEMVSIDPSVTCNRDGCRLCSSQIAFISDAHGRNTFLVETSQMPLPAAGERIAYGDGPQQFGELRLPKGDGPFPVVVLIHGGCWKNEFDYVYMTRLGAWFADTALPVGRSSIAVSATTAAAGPAHSWMWPMRPTSLGELRRHIRLIQSGFTRGAFRRWSARSLAGQSQQNFAYQRCFHRESDRNSWRARSRCDHRSREISHRAGGKLSCVGRAIVRWTTGQSSKSLRRDFSQPTIAARYSSGFHPGRTRSDSGCFLRARLHRDRKKIRRSRRFAADSGGWTL